MTAKMKKWLLNAYLVVATIGTLLFLLFNVLLPQLYYLKPGVDTEQYQPVLNKAATIALSNNDVPVAACLVYKNEIIAVGHNTVIVNNSICQHAEINAINNASNALGIKAFQQLNRKELMLISSFEPCLMCKGALIENRITNVVSVLPKSPNDRWLRQKYSWQYLWQQRKSNNPYFQYQLFLKHPEFNANEYPFRY